MEREDINGERERWFWFLVSGRLDLDWIKLINASGKGEKKCFLKEVRS
jgi:hypothetical protein